MPAARTAALMALSVSMVCTAASAGVVAIVRAGSPAASRPVAVTTPLPSTPAASTAPAATLDVNGAPVPVIDDTTVADALARAGITLRPGHYLAVVTQRRLGPDGRPGRVFIDGRPATLATPVHAGEKVTTQPGADLVEPTETVRVTIAAAASSSALYVGGHAGVARLIRGRLSHERVSQRILRRPQPGHLVRPGAVALTFDDGPAHGWTSRVLAMLARHHVHATFCMIGRWAAEQPAMVRRVARAGHALCDHTWDHDLDLRQRPVGQIRLDIRRGAAAIRRANGGHGPTFFRAPGGNWSPRIEQEARAAGMVPLTWSVDPRDWSRPGVHAIVHTVLAEVRPGGVILMHDGGGNRRQTLQALAILLHRLPKLGYHFVLPPAPALPHAGQPSASATPHE